MPIHSNAQKSTGPRTPAADRKIVQDFAQRRIFDRLLVYERRIEHSLYRTMAELRNLRRLREQDAAEAGTTAVSSVPVRAYLPSREETPDSVTTNVSEAESQPCETKPISEGVSSVKRQVLNGEPALQTSPLKLDTAAEPPDQSC